MTKTKQAPRVLPADVYDALELSALAFGGIGAGRTMDYADKDAGENPAPFCLYGHAGFVGPETIEPELALENAGIRPVAPNEDGEVSNDHGVRAINKRRGQPSDARVPFDALMKELNVVRGS